MYTTTFYPRNTYTASLLSRYDFLPDQVDITSSHVFQSYFEGHATCSRSCENTAKDGPRSQLFCPVLLLQVLRQSAALLNKLQGCVLEASIVAAPAAWAGAGQGTPVQLPTLSSVCACPVLLLACYVS